MQQVGDSDRWAAELDAVAATLSRLDDLSFGTCRTCQGDIPLDVLVAQPEAECCPACTTSR